MVADSVQHLGRTVVEDEERRRLREILLQEGRLPTVPLPIGGIDQPPRLAYVER